MISLKEIYDEFMYSIEDNDFGYSVNPDLVWIHGKKAIRSIYADGFLSGGIKSQKLTISTDTSSADIPSEVMKITKVGIIGSDDLIYVFKENKNISFISGPSAGAGISTDDDFNDFVFHNYLLDGNYGQIYGVAAGQSVGAYRIDEANDKIYFDTSSKYTECLIEYIEDPSIASNPEIHEYYEDAVKSYMYYKIVERKSNVPISEKQRARKEYYNDMRLAKARASSFSKEEALKTIRKNFKLANKL
tara:strand:+ start:2075 stop:2812 length:738 start_codon:yes stop_codon:yes gene_type:complete